MTMQRITIVGTGLIGASTGLALRAAQFPGEIVGWDRDMPAGMRLHVASFGDGVLSMTDVWDSEELFGTFVQTRILPGLRQLGIPGQPDMITQAAHEVTAAGDR